MTDWRRLAAESREAQGLPPTVLDPVALERVAALLDQLPPANRAAAPTAKRAA